MAECGKKGRLTRFWVEVTLLAVVDILEESCETWHLGT